MKKAYFILALLILCLSGQAYSQGTNPYRKKVSVAQTQDWRFTLSAERAWSGLGGHEEYWYYVQNNTHDEYKIVIDVTLELACVGTKSYTLGVNKIVHLMPNGRFTPDSDWAHIYSAGADNGKACRLKDGNSFTLFRGLRYTISSVINVTAQKALEEQKKKEAEALKQQELEKKKAEKEAEALKQQQEKERKEKEAESLKQKQEKERKEKEAEALKQQQEKERKEKEANSTTTKNNSDSGGSTGSGSSSGKSSSDSQGGEAGKSSTSSGSDGEARAAAADQQAQQREAEQREAQRRAEQREAEEKAAQQQEYERQQRQQTYYADRAATNQANLESATELTAAALLVHLFLGNLIYGTLGNEGFENTHKGDSWMVRFPIGYSITSAPIFTNSSITNYNGNTYTTTNQTKNFQTLTLDLNIGVEYWPIYGRKKGFGAFGTVSGGHGILFENFLVSGQAGAKGYIGQKNVQLYSEYSFGHRIFSHTPWINSEEEGDGDSYYNYHRLKVGPRFTFDPDKESATTHLAILPVFERPMFARTLWVAPVNVGWFSGLSAELTVEHRLQVFADYFWRYQRSGKVKYNFASDAQANGSMFRFGVIRVLDFYGTSGYSHPYQSMKELLGKTNTWTFYIPFPMVSLLSFQSHQVPSYNIPIGISMPGIEKEFTFGERVHLGLGLGATVGQGGTYRAESADFAVGPHIVPIGSDIRFKLATVDVPMHIRVSSDPISMNKFWVKAGLFNQVAVLKNADVIPTPGNSPIPEALADANSLLRTYISGYKLGVGIDFPVNPGVSYRTGISYTKSGNIIAADINNKIKVQNILLEAGIIF